MKKDEIETLFRTHYAKLHSLARVLLHDSDLARDVVHDVFLSLLDSDTAPDGCAAYLARGVRNRCLNIIRDTDTRRRLGMGYLLEMERYDLEDWPDEETLAELRKLMQTGLTDKCRRVAELRFTSGLSYAEIASELDISEVAVYKHLRHAIETIRKKFRRDGQV